MTMGLGSLFRALGGSGKPGREIVDRVKGWTSVALGPPPGTVIAVNEIVCTDPSCPGIETVILVMAPGSKTQAYKVSKPIEHVTELDVRGALV